MQVVEKVWPHVHKLSTMDDWSPWMSKDPEVKRTLTGTDGTVGAKMAWVSKVKNVGEGSQTIVSMKEHERIEYPSRIPQAI